MKLKRIMATLLTLVMLLGLAPMALAEGNEGGGGDPVTPVPTVVPKVLLTIGDAEPVELTLHDALEKAKEALVAGNDDCATIDLQNGTFDLTKEYNQFNGRGANSTPWGYIDIPSGVTFQNGTFQVTGVKASEGILYLSSNETIQGKKLASVSAAFTNVTFTGDGYSSGAGVIYAAGISASEGPATITLTNCTFNLKNEQGDPGKVLGGLTADVSTYNVTNCTFDLENTRRGFVGITLNMKNSTVTAKNSAKTMLRNVVGTIDHSEITVSNYDLGIENDGAGTLAIKNGSVVSLSDSKDKDLLLNLSVAGLTVDSTSSLTFTTHNIVSSDGTTYVLLNFNADGGTLPEGKNATVFMTSGGTVDLSEYTPTRSGYTFQGWLNGDGQLVPTGEYTVTETQTLTASWKKQSSGSSSPKKYTITVEDAEGGEVTSNYTRAPKGRTVTLTVEAEDGYRFNDLTVLDKNDETVTLTEQDDGTYTFKMPASNVTVTADFTVETSPFADVPLNSYFLKPVRWAVANGITSGMTETTFDPYSGCTRAQTVTFLWRAAGCPTPESAEMPFKDVPAGSYFYNAVLWAVENGIVNGMTADTFAPYAVCTRAHIVTFLFRYAVVMGMDAMTLQELVSSYDDAAEVPGYALAAFNWALYTGVTQGNDGKLLPNDTCTRAQIVTFLYRVHQA